MVSFRLDTNLETIVSKHEDLTYVVFRLVGWADAQGLLDKLVSGARDENPGNQSLQRYVDLTNCESQEIKETINSTRAPTDIALLDAAHSITVDFSRAILGDTRPVIREAIRSELARLIKSTTVYSILLGEPGSGKSTALATESLNLMELGWIVLPVTLTQEEFSVDNLTAELNKKLPSVRSLRWQDVIDHWGRGAVQGSAGLVIIIDKVDWAPSQVARELELLDDVVRHRNLAQIKVVLSCRTGVWEHEAKDLSFFRRTIEPTNDELTNVQVIPVGDFTDNELDQFLQGIHAENLLAHADAPAAFDYHVESVRSLLKKPETSREYSELLSRGEPGLSENLTWSKLIELRLQHDLEAAGAVSDILWQALAQFAELGRQQKSAEFRIDLALVKESVPALFAEIPGTTETSFSFLKEAGVLTESGNDPAHRVVEFQTVDTGSYLLSFTLEREARGTKHEEIQTLISTWLDEAWNYSPLLDALLAWMDRLSENQRDPLLLSLVATFIEVGRNISTFRLVDPRIIETVFALLETSDEDRFYEYREAALFLRPSPEAIKTIRSYLTSSSSLSRRLAAELVGVHQDQDSLPTLVALLEDDDEEVTSNTFQAFGRLGTAAVRFLLAALRNGSKSEVVRARYLSALRNIGFRSEAVSEALSEHLKDAMRGNSTYFRSGLLAAAHLRDKDQIPYAIAGLKHVDSDVAVAAAKLLKELPHPAAFDFLLEALTAKQDNEAHLSQRHWLERQLLAALAATDKNAAEPIVVHYLEQALVGKTEMHFTEVFDTAEKLRIPSVYSVLLQALVTSMTTTRDGKFIFLASEKLGDTWQPEPLALLRKAASKFLAEGVDIAKVFVDEILPNMREHDEFRIGDRLNRVKDLDALAKCQATNLVLEACSMLKEASELSAAKLSELFWLTGDARAESSLIEKLGQPMAKQRGRWIARNAIIRALGMCGSQSGIQVVLSYLRQEPEISLYFSEETLLPLLRRGAIAPRQLSEIVRDDTASVGGRIASISALADTDARAHKELFLKHSNDGEDQLVQFYAVQALARTEDISVIPKLRQLLKESTWPAIRSRSAEALSRLEAREAVKEIENAFNADPREGYINALAHFQEPSSLPLLLDKMHSVNAESRRPYYSALGAFSFLAPGREALLSEFEFSISKLPDYFGDQSALFKGTVLHSPNLLLTACQGQTTWGRLSYSGRKEISRWIYFLWTKSSADKRLLFEVAKRLISDPDLRVREMALHNVSLVTTGLGQELHASLIDDPNADERVRAYAVNSLGYWEGDRSEIDKFRTAKELLVRRAADAAIDLRERRLKLKFHVGQMGSSDGLARLSSYLCLKAHGDISTPWHLEQRIAKESAEAAYAGPLKKAIVDRLRNDDRKRQETEEKLVESRGTVWFD